MHRCLLILEIVENICGNFRYISLGLRSLAALARTCRSFQGPALDFLWAVQHEMWNLLRCMPLDLLAFEGRENALDVRLLRPIVATDWERPLVYMRRIRSMIIKPNAAIPNIFPALSTSFPRDVGSLFPKLTSLRWTHTKDLLCIRMLLSSQITSLYMSCNMSNADLSLFSTLPRRCPALKDFTVQCHGSSESSRHAFSSCLRGLHSLESVNVHTPDVAALEHLSQLPRLTSLFTFLPDDLSSSPPFSPLPFVGLEILSFRYTEIEPVTYFFRRCSGASFKDIGISLSSCSTTAAIDMLHTALRDGCSHGSLSSLHIDNGEYDPPPGGDGMTNMKSLRLLFCFVNITSIYITSYVGFNIDNDGMKELALAWPRLEVLRFELGADNDTHPHPRLSLLSLRTFAEHCQTLTELELTIDATFIPNLDPNPSGRTRRVSQSTLCKLNVGKSLISESLSVARFISAIFPCVSELETDRTHADNNDPDELEERAEAIALHNIWMEVRAQLPVLIAIREEERSWAQEQLGI
ncbi:hypothetical protein K438DRAFT_2012326 [Mycena galopus ATCC 62051]|nr:hypothetical protein K438DRAFT_2012326 [Mycena galopus ATCC 62051]